MGKMTLAAVMLPFLAGVPALAAGSVSSGEVLVAQAGGPGSQEACSLAQQNAQDYARILQLRDKMVRIQRDNDARFRVLEKGRGGDAPANLNLGSTRVLDEAMRDMNAGSASGGYAGQGAAMDAELLRDLTGKSEDIDTQIRETDNQLQKTQEDNEFRFQELEKKRGIASPKGGPAPDEAPRPAAPDLCAQGITSVGQIAGILGARTEAMNFQLLEMQDRMQKMQEDNERRFQALESGQRANAGPAAGTDAGAGAGASAQQAASDRQPALQGGGGNDMAPAQAASGSQAGSQGGSQIAQGRGQPPRSLGSISFDSNGNVIGETMNEAPQPPEQGLPQGGAPAGAPQRQARGTDVAKAGADGDGPKALYQAAYQYLMAGDYKAAEAAFRKHVKLYPSDPMTAEARFWLGESIYDQGRYPEAATVFLDTQRDYPNSRRAPENMFKLGMTLEKMGNHDVGCATFAQIPQRYPKAPPAILRRVADERQRNKCG